MKLRKTSAAVFVALMAVGAGAEAGQITSMTGTGTFTGGLANNTPWSGTLTMDVSSGTSFSASIPTGFSYLGSNVAIGSVGSGLHADDAGTVDFKNLAITWAASPGSIFVIGDGNDAGLTGSPPPMVMTVNSLAGGNFNIAWTGGSGIGPTSWTFAGTYQTASVVPIPAAAWLFGSAVLGVAGLSRRRKEKAEDAIAA